MARDNEMIAPVQHERTLLFSDLVTSYEDDILHFSYDFLICFDRPVLLILRRKEPRHMQNSWDRKA
jgi:hypothetical protein